MRDSLVMFGATWCAPCKKTRPVAEAVAAEAGVPFEYVDIESGDARVGNILSVPVLRVYDVSGTPVAEHTGGASAAQVRALVGA